MWLMATCHAMPHSAASGVNKPSNICTTNLKHDKKSKCVLKTVINKFLSSKECTVCGDIKNVKTPKMGQFGVVRGHPRSSEMSPFDRAHMTSYSTMRLSGSVFEI